MMLSWYDDAPAPRSDAASSVPPRTHSTTWPHGDAGDAGDGGALGSARGAGDTGDGAGLGSARGAGDAGDAGIGDSGGGVGQGSARRGGVVASGSVSGDSPSVVVTAPPQTKGGRAPRDGAARDGAARDGVVRGGAGCSERGRARVVALFGWIRLFASESWPWCIPWKPMLDPAAVGFFCAIKH